MRPGHARRMHKHAGATLCRVFKKIRLFRVILLIHLVLKLQSLASSRATLRTLACWPPRPLTLLYPANSLNLNPRLHLHSAPGAFVALQACFFLPHHHSYFSWLGFRVTLLPLSPSLLHFLIYVTLFSSFTLNPFTFLHFPSYCHSLWLSRMSSVNSTLTE
jgi:hypothetical protein